MLVGARPWCCGVAIVVAALTSACALSPTPLAWRIEIADASIRDRVEVIEARILRGGCGGVLVFSSVVRADDGVGPTPPVLAPGVWGFDARANDASCVRVAESCVEITLPGTRDVLNRLEASTASQACTAARCDRGECSSQDADGDGVDACVDGETLGACDCDDADASVRPGAEDPCADGDDQDCDGADDGCDADCDGFPESESGGVDGLDCDDDDDGVHPSGSPSELWGMADGDRLARGCEAMPMPMSISDGCVMGPSGPMGDAIDQDCNGFVDDGPGCTDPTDLDRDGFAACRSASDTECDTNDCDPGVAPSRAERCGNGIDDDGDPSTSDSCPAGDADGDGQTSSFTMGRDCDDDDPRVFAGAPDDCLTPEDESCGVAPTTCEGDEDGDGYVGRLPSGRGDCNDRDPAVRPFADEDACNGADDDCDGIVDEVMRSPDASPGVTDGCVRASGGAVAVDFHVDGASSAHCGGCGVSTAANEDCCDATPTAIDTLESCGTCGFACGAHTRCVAAGSDDDGGIFACECERGSMDGRWEDCDGSLAMGGGDGCETNLEADDANCGACGNACGASQRCEAAACVCEVAFLDCDGIAANGCEVNGATSTSHCGGCGRTCAAVLNASERCSPMGCDYTSCDTMFADCDGSRGNGCETSLRSVTSCGTCGTNCTTRVANANGRTCGAFGCDYTTCATGWGDCDGMRTNGCERALGSPSACGGCGIACGAGETCNAMLDCECGATTSTDGEACPGSMACVAGACVP